MDLRNGNITLREILANPRAKALLQREFSQMVSGPMLMIGQGMSLNRILTHVGGKVSKQKLDDVLRQLREM
ncbi:MAG: hypothetical protein VB086_06455 [Clostridiaceae bacterium]|nr:hypothetical protein [Clostridiaceae bacterium]